MTKEKILDFIKKALASEKLDCSVEPSPLQPEHQRLLVNLGKDYKHRSRTLEITTEDLALHPYVKKRKIKQNQYCRLQFFAMFPFQSKDEMLTDVSSLLLFLNRTLDLPGLELNELDNRIFYRYVLVTTSTGLDKDLILSIVGMIQLILDLFTHTIEKVADGTHTFNELLDQVIQTTEQMLNMEG